jgi:Helix-turn-helix domain
MQNGTSPMDAEIIQLRFSKKNRRRAEDKFGAPVMKLGFTLIPNLLLQAQGRLKISPVQLTVLAQLFQHWWNADDDPFPRKETIARRLGKSERTIQRYLTQLETAKLIKRVPRFKGHRGQTSNGYDLSGLVAKLAELEPEFTKAAEQKRLKQKKIETAAGA